MPLSADLGVHRLAERIQLLRKNPFAAYGIAIAAVAVATIIRWSIGEYVLGRTPFTVYFLAIVLATLLGGFWPGMLATTLSVVVAWFFFVPPEFSFSLNWPDATSLLVFISVSLLLVGLITLVDDWLLNEIERRRNNELAALHLAAIVESSDDAIVTKDLNGVIASWNKGAEGLFGYSADEVIGKPINILIPPERDDEEPAILERVRRGERIDHYETVRRRKDGSLIDISLTVSPIKDATGGVVGVSKIARDIAERKEAAERQEMLIREMSHRVKNAFALVNGIVALSARSASTPQELAQTIGARLAALARAHDLARPGLLQAEAEIREPMTLHALIRAVLAPYLDSDGSMKRERLIIKGCDVPIAEKAVSSLALVLHELATNSVKLGSLSLAKGGVRVDCSSKNGQVLVTWKEQRGPRLNGQPQHEGFGTLLANRIVTGQFGGEIFYDWRPAGLVVRLSAPMERITG
jgi:PAS domain S-box-containing protein